MNILSRRGFLRGVGSAGAAALAVTAPTVARAQPAENSDLLALAPKLTAAEDAFRVADEAKRQAVASFNATCPPVPTELIAEPRSNGLDFCPKRETDAEGHTVWSSDGRCSRWIIDAHGLRLDVQDYSARTKFGRLARQKLKVAEAYEQARNTARAASGIDVAIEARHFAARDLEQVGDEINKARALTLAGAVLKARALSACAAIGSDVRYRASILWAHDLAETVLRVGSQGGTA